MPDTIVVCGHGPGISSAVAQRFGAAGFQVALVARNAGRVQAAARALADGGVTARGYGCDLSDPAAVRALIGQVRSELGPITVVHWNAYSMGAGDLLTCDLGDLRATLDLAVSGLVAAVQAALPDLRAQKHASVLVTGGGFAFYEPGVDAMIVQFAAMGLGVAKAAQHKLVGVLHQKLAPEGIYVGEVVVLGLVKGTAFDQGQATLEPSAIAERFWELHTTRRELSVQIG